MLARILDHLASLASVPVQERYIVRGTREEYLLPQDIINEVDQIPTAVDRAAELGLSQKQVDALRRFWLVFEDVPSSWDPEAMPRDALIYRDPTWAALRDAASGCLEEYGFDLTSWEQEELQ